MNSLGFGACPLNVAYEKSKVGCSNMQRILPLIKSAPTSASFVVLPQ